MYARRKEGAEKLLRLTLRLPAALSAPSKLLPFALIGGVAALAGCASTEPVQQAGLEPAPTPSTAWAPLPESTLTWAPTPAPAPPASRHVVLGKSVQGRPIDAHLIGNSKGCVLIMGGIHGDEPVSSALVEMLVRHLEAHPEDTCGKLVVVIPRANPDGLRVGTRRNIREVDLNRNFLTDNFRASRGHGDGPLSEPESRAIVKAVAQYEPSCIVSVHGPLNCIDPDGGYASTALARRMAEVSPLPVKDLDALPGSFGSYGGNMLGLKMITYELDRKGLPARGLNAYLRPHLPALLLAIREG
jgi:protein MpaA